MPDPLEVLQPLADAEPAVAALRDYESTAELADALQTTGRAIDRALRRLLRSDLGAPDVLRLAAFSPDDLPTDRVVEALRQRDLISLELAGMVHELQAGLERAATGEPRAGDADVALAAVARMRTDVRSADEASLRESVRSAVTEQALTEAPQPVPPAPPRRRRALALVAGALLLLIAVGVVSVILMSRPGELQGGIAAFRAGQVDVAEQEFRGVLERDPNNVTALVYLGRIYRREGRYDEAAGVLRRAAALDRDDPGVRRELGHLFLELGRPEAAAEEYQRALEVEPERAVTWIGLIRALRAANDPRAEEYLQRAPPAARAALDQPD